MEIVPSIMQECFIPIQYRFSPEAIKNCLQEVLSEGNINSQVSAPANNDYMTKKHRDDIIKKHMFPMTLVPPKYLESWIVCWIDKKCSTRETLQRRCREEVC